MPYETVTLTSANVPGASAAANLNWIGGKPATVWVSAGTSTSSGAFNVQYTMDDIQRLGGSSLALWAGVSSAQGQPATTFNSTTSFPDGVFVQFLSPVAAVRINSTSMSSGPLTMKILQGE